MNIYTLHMRDVTILEHKNLPLERPHKHLLLAPIENNQSPITHVNMAYEGYLYLPRDIICDKIILEYLKASDLAVFEVALANHELRSLFPVRFPTGITNITPVHSLNLPF
jgi:hypothetical protein